MSQLDPNTTSVNDLVTAAIQESGAVGVGQTPSAQEIPAIQARMGWMMQKWQRKRWLVYHLVEKLITSTGAVAYTIGPTGNIKTAGDFAPADFSPTDFNDAGSNLDPESGLPVSTSGTAGQRPDKLEAAFLRQLTQSPSNQPDYPLEIVHSYEDYSRISLKKLVSFPGICFYDPAMPNGLIKPWPIPQANIYAIGVIIKEQLPTNLSSLSQVLILPWEYYSAIVTNLALECRSFYGIGTFPGDTLPGRAADALNVLKGANTAISSLSVPQDLVRRRIYNIFSDRMY